MDLTRRTLLKGSAGALGASAFAGCLDDVARGSGDLDSGYAAFFALWDWTDAVGGEEVDFRNPIDAGEMGHGWEPEGDLTADVASTDAFVYLDTSEFAWAQDVAETLEADYETVAVIDALDGLEGELLAWDHSHDEHDDDHEGGHDDHGHDDDHGDSHDDHDHDDSHGSDDHDHDDSHGGDDGHDDHDHEDFDPHIWVDPVLAQDLVDNIADGLADADPDNADVYEANADDYNSRLEDVDRQFEDLVDDAERSVAVLAGHDSFTYLEERYGFDLHTPVGVSPQDEPSHGEISETIDLVDGEGIETILYDRFEAPGDGIPNLAETIIDGSDATEAMGLTPVAGTLEEWTDRGWGYVEQMEEINIPAFREALGAQ